MWSSCGSTARGENCSEEEAPFGLKQVESRRTLRRFHRFWLKAPELKAMSVNRRFDRISGKIVRRSSVRSDHTNLSPGPKLIGQFAARHIFGERSQTNACF